MCPSCKKVPPVQTSQMERNTLSRSRWLVRMGLTGSKANLSIFSQVLFSVSVSSENLEASRLESLDSASLFLSMGAAACTNLRHSICTSKNFRDFFKSQIKGFRASYCGWTTRRSRLPKLSDFTTRPQEQKNTICGSLL